MKDLGTNLVVLFIKYRLFYSLAIILLFSSPSCSLFTSQIDASLLTGENHSSFILDEILGQVVETQVNGLPQEIKISYKACFRDFVHQDNSLPNTGFRVHLFESVKHLKKGSDQKCSESRVFLFSDKLETSCLQMRTDASGCLNWTEIYPYKWISESVWFRYGRAFEGTGVNKGLSLVSMAVNPWLSADPSGSATQLQFMDLRYNSLEKIQLIQTKKKDISACSLCRKGEKSDSCFLCEQKQNSLSYVIENFEKIVKRPQLWLNNISLNINQEYFHFKNPTSKQKEILRKLRVCHGEIKTDCDSTGRFFKVQLKMPLKIRVRNYRGEVELLPLIQGEYSIQPYFLLKDDKERYWSLHRDTGFLLLSLDGGSSENQLTAEFYLHIPYENLGLPALLGLKIRTAGKLKPFLLPFDGLFSFPNTLKSIHGRNSLSLNREVASFYEKNPANLSFIDKSLNIQRRTKDEEKEKGSEEDSQIRFTRAKWVIELKRMRFVEVGFAENKCPSPVERHVRYVGEVCIKDPLTGDYVSNTKIKISRQIIEFSKDGRPTGGAITEVSLSPPETNREGCLQWFDEIPHKWYDRQRYYIRRMIFSQDDWGFQGEKILAINPWHWGFIFYQDVTELISDLNQEGKRVPIYSQVLDQHVSSYIRVNPSREEKPQIFLHDFRSLFIEPIYAIDRWLGINIFHNIMLLFKVRIDRPDGMAIGLGGQRPSAMDIRRGYYLVRFILLKSHVEEQGGQGNQVQNLESFLKTYQNSLNQSWNTNEGWKMGRSNGSDSGQMMNTNLEYITHFDTYVQVRDSMVNNYINFRFDLDDFIFIGSNNRIIVQLFPTDPKYYRYEEGSCKVDPEKSQFVPYKDHDLISKPFIGAFIPGDPRNWNIFKVLDGNLNLDDLINNDRLYKTSFIKLNTELDLKKLIQEGEKNSWSHRLFKELQSKMISKSLRWSQKSQHASKNFSYVFTTLDEAIGSFLYPKKKDIPNGSNAISSGSNAISSGSNALPSENAHLLDGSRNHLADSLMKAFSLINEILIGTQQGNEQKTFYRIKNILLKILDSLESSASKTELSNQVRKQYVALLNLMEGVASIEQIKETNKEHRLLNTLDTENEKKYIEEIKNQHFKSNIEIPESYSISTFNMNQYAKDEGLKVIAMDDVSMKNFLADLNQSIQQLNLFRSEHKSKKKAQATSLSSTQREVSAQGLPSSTRSTLEKKFQKMPNQYEIKNSQDLEEAISTINQYEQVFFNNFARGEGESLSDFFQKIEKMHLPKMSQSWLEKILVDGIHERTVDTIEVATFLHSMCSFWFDKFYDQYLEKRQLDIIYAKHKDHFDYYKATGEYSTDEIKKYQSVWKAMGDHHLSAMDPELLKTESPFCVSGSNEGWGSFLDELGQWFFEEEKTSHTCFEGESQKFHPYLKCISNPVRFFHIENKIIVGEIGSDYNDLSYEYGQTSTFYMQKSFDFSYGLNWAMSRSFSSSLGSGFATLDSLERLGGSGKAIKKFLNTLRSVSPFFSFSGVRLNADWATSRSESEASRRQQTLRFSRALDLVLNHSVMSIRLKEFRHCLMIRPQNLAFEGYEQKIWKQSLEDDFIHQVPYIKSGILICSADKDSDRMGNPFTIKEDYFYLYQPNRGDRGQFQNPLNFRNRPYVITIRGVADLEKFEFLVQSFVEPNKTDGIEDYNPQKPMTNPYNQQSNVPTAVRRAFTSTKIWDMTGFYPGVYNVKYNENHYYFHTSDLEARGYIEGMGNWLYDANPFSNIRLDENPKVIDRSPQ